MYTSDGQKVTVWIAPANFVAMRHINNPQVLSSEDMTGRSSAERRDQKVMFVEKGNLSSWSLFISHNALSVVSTNAITAGKELFVDYGIKYCFTKCVKCSRTLQ